MRTVAGLDTASDRYHLYCNNGFQHYIHIPKSSKIGIDGKRLALYHGAIEAFALLPEETLLVCEESLALQNGKTTRVLGNAVGAIWAAHVNYNIFWAWVNVSTWKKDVIGKGNADKDQVKAWVMENMGLEFPESEPDFYDAACICRYGELELAKLPQEA